MLIPLQNHVKMVERVQNSIVHGGWVSSEAPVRVISGALFRCKE